MLSRNKIILSIKFQTDVCVVGSLKNPTSLAAAIAKISLFFFARSIWQQKHVLRNSLNLKLNKKIHLINYLHETIIRAGITCKKILL